MEKNINLKKKYGAQTVQLTAIVQRHPVVIFVVVGGGGFNYYFVCYDQIIAEARFK